MAMMKLAAGFAVATVARAAGLQSKGSAEATDLMYTQVKAMASEIASSGRAPTGLEQDWLDSIVSYVQNTSTPAIMQGHQDDQALMDNAVSGLVACEVALESDTVSVNSMKSATDDKAIDHEGCRADESSKETATVLAWNDLKNVYVGLSPPTAPNFSFDVTGDYLAQAQEFERIMSAFVAESEAFATGLQTSYNGARQTYENASSEHEDKQKLCDKSQEVFESSYCQWLAGAESALDKHEDCWETGSDSFNLVKSTVLNSGEQRKHEYASMQKILCFVQMLQQSFDPNATDTAAMRTAACDGLAVNTSFLDLVNLDIPHQSTPDFGNLTQKPGDAAWKDVQYGAFPKNAPAAPVMACAGGATSTQGPESSYSLY